MAHFQGLDVPLFKRQPFWGLVHLRRLPLSNQHLVVLRIFLPTALMAWQRVSVRISPAVKLALSIVALSLQSIQGPCLMVICGSRVLMSTLLMASF